MRCITFPVALFIALFLAAPLAWAGPLEDADALLKAGRGREAESAYTRLIRETPAKAELYLGRAKARVLLKDAAGANADLDKAVSLAPASPEVLRRRSLMRLELRDFEGALEDMDKVVSMAPRQAAAYRNRAGVQLAAKNYSAVVADSTEAIRLDPANAIGYAQRAQGLEQLGETEAALADYDKALSINPAHEVSRARRAALMQNTGVPEAPATGALSPPKQTAASAPSTTGANAGSGSGGRAAPKQTASAAKTPAPPPRASAPPANAAPPAAAKTPVQSAPPPASPKPLPVGGNTPISVHTQRPDESAAAYKARMDEALRKERAALAYFAQLLQAKGADGDNAWGSDNKYARPTTSFGTDSGTHAHLIPTGSPQTFMDLMYRDAGQLAPGHCRLSKLAVSKDLTVDMIVFGDPPLDTPESFCGFWSYPDYWVEISFTAPWRTPQLDLTQMILAVHRGMVEQGLAQAAPEAPTNSLAFQTDPAERKELRADGLDGVMLKARVQPSTGTASAAARQATQGITFTADGDGANWIDFTKSELRGDWKCVLVRASNPNSVRGGANKPPPTFTITAHAQDGGKPLSRQLSLTAAADPEIDAKPDLVEFAAQSGQSVQVKVSITNAGPDPWTFRTEYAPKNRALATVDLRPKEGSGTTLTLKEAGLDPRPDGTNDERSVLRIFAERKDRAPLQRDIKVAVGQEGLFIAATGRDPNENLFRLRGDGSGRPTEIEFRVYAIDPSTKKMVNLTRRADVLRAMTVECLEPKGSVAATVLELGQCQPKFTGIRPLNEPAGILRLALTREIPGDGRIVPCDFRLTYNGRGEEAFTSIISVGVVTTSNGPGGANWQTELARCQEIITKFVPVAYQPRLQAMLDQRKMTLGAQGLSMLRQKLWSAAVQLTLGEGGQGYANEAAWAGAITEALEWSQWAGDMAFGAVIGTWTGPYGSLGASVLKGSILSALNAYQEGRGPDEWLWENLCTIPGMLEGKIIDVDTFEKMGVQNKAKAWALFIAYHFSKNLYQGASVYESLKNTGKEVGSGLLTNWLNEKVKKSAGKGTPPVSYNEPQAATLIRSRMRVEGGKRYANCQDVLAIMRDPSLVRALKTARPEIQEAFSNTREAIYRQHDAAVVAHVKSTMPELKYTLVKVMEFRTPGQTGASLNTDRDYRVCYYAGIDKHTGKEQWIEVDRRKWEDKSYEAFAEATNHPVASPAEAKHWAELHQQLGTDKFHAEASPDFSDQTKVWNPQKRQFENVQVVPNIVRVKSGQPGVSLKDPQALGHMYQMKVGDAKFPHEKFVQAQKAVKELDALRTAYKDQDRAVGKLPPKVQAGMDAVIEVNKKLAADPNRRDPKAIAQAEATLRANGFQNLDDFMNKLSGQFEWLKTR